MYEINLKSYKEQKLNVQLLIYFLISLNKTSLYIRKNIVFFYILKIGFNENISIANSDSWSKIRYSENRLMCSCTKA